MISIAPVRILFLVLAFILVQHSSQQELFEDAVKRETVGPHLDSSFYSNNDEVDTEEPYEQYNGAPEEREPEEGQQEHEDEDADAERRAGYPIDGNEDRRFSQEVPAFNEEENEDEDVDEEDSKAPYNDVEREIDEDAKKRSGLENFEQSKKITKKLKSTHKKNKIKSSQGKEKASKKSKIQKRNIKKAERKDSAKKTEAPEGKRKEYYGSSSSGLSSGEGSSDIADESSGDDESSGAERERRQAFQTEDQVLKAKEKLKSAQEASDALTSIEREMGLDPSAAPGKTKNLTSALHSEIQKFKDIISTQNDDVKKSKFQKLEKLAEEDVKGANDVMKLIVELEVAKFFAKHRARKKLEVALRNKITNPPSPPQPAAPTGLGFGGMAQYQNQAGMADFMPQEQSFTPNPYVPFADELQAPPQQAPAMPFPSAPQVPFQPSPIAAASFQPAPLPPAPIQPFNPPPAQNPLQGQFQDALPSRWTPQVASFAPVPQAPQEYNPYMANPMGFAAGYGMPQPNPQPQLRPNVVNQPTMSKPQKIVKVALKQKVAEKKPAKPAQQQDNRPQPKPPQPQPQPRPQQASFLPQSSPFSGLKPLESLNPVVQPVPSFSPEMQSQRAPFSSYTQNPFAVSSSHPFSDALAAPPPHPNTQAFFPQSSWASPPPKVNQFSDSLSHLNPHYQKPAAPFKPVSPPVKAGQRPHPPDLAKMLKDLARYRSRPITAQQFRPAPSVQAPEPQRLHEPSPPSLQTPPMYSQFDYPGQPEPAIPIQQPVANFAPPIQQYYNPGPQAPQMPFVSPQAPMSAPLPIQGQTPPMQYSNEQKNNDMDEDEDEDFDPMDQQFNDNPSPQPVGLQYQGPAVYPQQQQPLPQAYSGYNAWPNTGMTDSFLWPQNANPQAYGYQPALSYEQIVNPLLTEALNKVHDTQKAAKVVQKIESTIGLSPPAVNHIIDDVESETKKEKMQFDQNIKNDEEEIQKDKKLMDSDNGTISEETQKKLQEEKKKLDDDKKRDEVAKTKLATIQKIEKILTIIETAKYSALKRAKEHLLKMKTEKDPQIRKRDLETLENDLKKSEANHLHRRNEINIWLKGSRNNINTSHFLEGKRKEKEKENEVQKKSYNAFGSPSIPKLAIAKFAAKIAKKSKIAVPVNTEENKAKEVKKPKIGIILMRKLLQRMDDLYDMQSKILTQLIKDHQQVKDQKERNRKKRNIHNIRHRHHHPHANHHRHHQSR